MGKPEPLPVSFDLFVQEERPPIEIVENSRIRTIHPKDEEEETWKRLLGIRVTTKLKVIRTKCCFAVVPLNRYNVPLQRWELQSGLKMKGSSVVGIFLGQCKLCKTFYWMECEP
jgi:hypothetical protein